MKTNYGLFVFAVLFLQNLAFGQPSKPSFSIAFFGEGITHPGLKVGLAYDLTGWSNPRKEVAKTISLGSSVGFYFHRRYQTGVFVLPELAYNRQNVKGRSFSFGFGLGYLRTFIPNTYEVDVSGEIAKITPGHNYFLSNLFVAFGKKVRSGKGHLKSYYVKPQLLYAIPNFPNGVGYFALEVGLKLN